MTDSVDPEDIDRWTRHLPGLLEYLTAKRRARVGADTPLARDAVGAAPFLVAITYELEAHPNVLSPAGARRQAPVFSRHG